MKVSASDLKVGDRVREDNVFDFNQQKYVGPKTREVIKIDRHDGGVLIDIHFDDGGSSLCRRNYKYDVVTETLSKDWDDFVSAPLRVINATWNDAGEVTLLIQEYPTGDTVRVLLVTNELSQSLITRIKRN